MGLVFVMFFHLENQGIVATIPLGMCLEKLEIRFYRLFGQMPPEPVYVEVQGDEATLYYDLVP